MNGLVEEPGKKWVILHIFERLSRYISQEEVVVSTPKESFKER
jgi:hypothetical protein